MGFRFPDITKLPNFVAKHPKPDLGKTICCVKCGRSTGTLRKIGEGQYAHAECLRLKRPQP
jgi:hypothetical protein